MAQWGQKIGVYSSGFQSLSRRELRTSTLGWGVHVCLCVCMLTWGNEESGFNCVVPGERSMGAVDMLLNYKNALRRRREGLGLGTWCTCPRSSSPCLTSMTVLSSVFGFRAPTPRMFLDHFQGWPPCVVHEIFHTEGRQGFSHWIRQEALLVHEQTKGQTDEAIVQTPWVPPRRPACPVPFLLALPVSYLVSRDVTTSGATLNTKAVLSSASKSLLPDFHTLWEVEFEKSSWVCP